MLRLSVIWYRVRKRGQSDKCVHAETADFVLPSKSLQLPSLIHCSFRQHKHWHPGDVCSLWGCLPCTADTRFKLNYMENTVFCFFFLWVKNVTSIFQGAGELNRIKELAQGHRQQTRGRWGNHIVRWSNWENRNALQWRLIEDWRQCVLH